MSDLTPPDVEDEESRWQLEVLEQTRREGERLAALRSAHDFGALRRRLIRRFAEEIVPRLRAIGFQGRLPHLYRARGDVVDLLMLQVDRYGGGFTVNLGRLRPPPDTDPASLRLHAVPFDQRARLTRDASGREDRWFRYDGPTGTPEEQQDQAIDELAPWLEAADGWWRDGRQRPHVMTG